MEWATLLTTFSVFRWYFPEMFKLWSSTPLNYDINNCMCICLLFCKVYCFEQVCSKLFQKPHMIITSFIHVVLLLLSIIILIIHTPWIVWTCRFCLLYMICQQNWLWCDCLNFNFSYNNNNNFIQNTWLGILQIKFGKLKNSSLQLKYLCKFKSMPKGYTYIAILLNGLK